MKLRMSRKAGAVATSGLALAALVMSVGTASADPTGAPTHRALAGVGSDTTFAVMNGLSDEIAIGGTKQIGSYDPTGASTVSPKAAANCQNLPRANGSSAGRTALLNALTPGNAIEGCYDFARSSSLSLASVPAVTGGLTYVPFGVDAFTYAYKAGGAIPSDLAVEDLQSIYKCEVPGITPLLPQAGSGTRQYWLGQMGITEAQLTTTYTCVKDVKNGTPVQEHDGRAITAANEVAPFSIASWVAQAAGAQTDNRGSAVLANTAGTSSLSAGSATQLKRDVYNVIPTDKIATAPWSTVFVGSGSLLCDEQATINKFGFASHANCGSTTNQTPTS